MMKKFSTLDKFENASIANKDKKQIKGGHTRVENLVVPPSFLSGMM
ncbi:MAG: hypothetical protein R2769_15960 [Saprospiraceae bacterium]